MDSADIHSMESDYQRMGTEERRLHHDELRNDGFEWCPECGSALVWDLPTPQAPDRRAGKAPIVSGDCPPLTAEQLAATAPATH